MESRIKKQGTPGIKWGENIIYGKGGVDYSYLGDHSMSVIQALLVDDGVADRIDRKHLF